MASAAIYVDLYCHKHDAIHRVGTATVERLIYQYQRRIAEAATSRPLPAGNVLTDLEYVSQNAFCPVEDTKSAFVKSWSTWINATLTKKRKVQYLNRQTKARRNRLSNREGVKNDNQSRDSRSCEESCF